MTAKGDRDDLARLASSVARELFGEPNKQLSSKDELRFGAQGSMSVDVATGQFYDHEAKEGGGVLWAVARVTGKPIEGGQAVAWLRDNGFHVEDRDPPPRGSDGGASAPPERKPVRYDKNGNYLPNRVPDHGVQTAIYEYRDAAGKVAYEVVRFDWDDPESAKGHDKTFVQRRPDPSKKHGYDWSVKGMTMLPYRLPELIEDIAQGETIFIVEGEKKVDRLRALGVPATCNTGGAGKFPESLIDWFKGARVVILPDNDPQAVDKNTGELRFHPDGRPVFTGKDHAVTVAGKLHGVAASARVLELPGLPLKGDVVDWLDAGGTPERLYDLVPTAYTPAVEAYASKFDAVTWDRLDDPGPEHEWLIKNLLTRNELSMCAGASQSGKTFVVLDQAMAIARGVEWMGRKTLRGGVVYCAPEGSRGLRRKRLKAYRQFYDIAHKPMPFTLLQSGLDLYSGDDVTDALIEEIKHWARTFDCPLELVVIDTFSKATPGMNENDGAEVGRVLERCERIRRATGAHVMLVHHLNADGTKARGHTSIFANLENVTVCRKVENHHDDDKRQLRELVISKQKEGEDSTTFRFVLQQVEIGRDADDEPVTSCIVARPSGSPAAEDAVPKGIVLDGPNKVVLRALYELLEKEGVFAPTEMNLPFGTMVVTRKALGNRYAQLASADEDTTTMSPEDRERHSNKVRQQLQRARDLLYSKEIIGMDEQFVWATGKRPVAGFLSPPGQTPQRKRAAANDAPEREVAPFSIDDDFGGIS